MLSERAVLMTRQMFAGKVSTQLRTGSAGRQVGIDEDGSIAVVPEGDLADAAAAAGTMLALDRGSADADALLWQAASLVAERQLGA